MNTFPGRSPAAWARSIVTYAAFGVFMAMLNPFGSVDGVSFPMAVLYWVVLIIWGGIAGEVLGWLIWRTWPNWPAWASVLALSIPQTLLILPAVLAMEECVMLRDISANAPTLAFFVWLVTAAGGALRVLIARVMQKQAEQAAVPPPPATPPATFLDRLPVKFRSGDLYAVSAEDHYLRVHTSLGETLILMRLTDAIREIGALDGQQTHRSWWVAKQGLADVTKGDGKLVLKLKSGAEAPVSRTYQAAVKAAGWV